MDVKQFDKLLKNLGENYNALITSGAILPKSLQELYPGRDWVDIQPEDGVELSYWGETERLERIFFTLLESIPGVPIYRGELPAPYALIMNQSKVRELFGQPLEIVGPVKLPHPIGWKGGWDSFKLDEVNYPNTKVVFQYTEDLNVEVLNFTLIDKGHD